MLSSSDIDSTIFKSDTVIISSSFDFNFTITCLFASDSPVSAPVMICFSSIITSFLFECIAVGVIIVVTTSFASICLSFKLASDCESISSACASSSSFSSSSFSDSSFASDFEFVSSFCDLSICEFSSCVCTACAFSACASSGCASSGWASSGWTSSGWTSSGWASSRSEERRVGKEC